jgi:hypothetical protein
VKLEAKGISRRYYDQRERERERDREREREILSERSLMIRWMLSANSDELVDVVSSEI